MLFLFRNNRPWIILFLLLYTFLVRLPALLNLTDYRDSQNHGGVLASGTFWAFFEENKPISVGLAAVLVFIQSLIINNLDARFRIADNRTWLPALAYVTLTALFPQTLLLSPPLVAVTFLPVAMSMVFNCYKQIQANALIFNASFWMGVASLFFAPMVVLLLPMWLGLLNIKSMNFRENMVFLSGYIVPMFLCWTVLFLMDSCDMFWTQQYKQLWQLPSLALPDSLHHTLALGIAALLLLMSLLLITFFYAHKLIQVQKMLNMYYWILIVGVFIFVFSGTTDFRHFIVALMPLSQLLGMYWSNSKLKILSEGVHLLLLGAVMYFQIRYL